MSAAAVLGGGGVLVGSALRIMRLSRRITWAPPAGSTGRAALAYRVVGSGVPATVLLHGMFASGRYWGAPYDSLAEESTLLVPDLAGFGRSVEVADGFGPKAHAGLVARTIAEVGVAGRPVVIGAHSLGCLVAIQLARRHPDLVAGIVAFSPPLYADEAAARRCLRRANPLVGLFVASPSLSEAVCDWMCEHRNIAAGLGRVLRPELPRPLAEDRFKHTYRSYSQTLARVIVTAGAAGWIKDVTVPIHLVAGTHDDVVDLAFLRQVSESYAHVSLAVWPDAEHELPLSQPEVVRGRDRAAACVADARTVWVMTFLMARPDSRMRRSGEGEDVAMGTVDGSGYNYAQFRRHHLVEEVMAAVALRGVPPGAPAPELKLPRVGDGALSLAELGDRPTLLHFGSFT